MDVKKVADAISNLRKQKGLTQKQLAQQFRISDKSVSKWERAETMPDISLLRALTDVAGLKGIIPFFVLIIGATAYTTVAVCKNLPSWSVIAPWTAVGACAVIVCTIAQDAFVEMYSEFTAGIISYHTASFLIYSGIVFCAGALILNVLSKKFVAIPNKSSD